MTSPDSNPLAIKRGHCYLVDMNPPRRSKPGKVRPVVVLQSTDTLEIGSPGVVTVPLTTQLQPENILRIRIKPSESLQIGKASDVLLDQIHTIDRSLFLKELGPILAIDFQRIENGARFLLNF
ncbi:MAG: type II toxin-antitoxin system PemK/MazF family toxin [Deltaproteobacteria bacterium]|nr:type II toxin-antitoxin system PemK/MazF family toxin [Deltaproteobacteria bacterium]